MTRAIAGDVRRARAAARARCRRSRRRWWSQERPKPARRPTSMLGGDFTRTGDRVEPGVPAVLPPLPTPSRGDRPDRLDLARWLVDPRNPLTARVTVNRIWQAYFGRGLVETENDFGTQGAADASRAARLAGHRVRRARLEPEGDAPADRHLGDLPAVVAGAARAGGDRPGQPAPRRGRRGSGSTPR